MIADATRPKRKKFWRYKIAKGIGATGTWSVEGLSSSPVFFVSSPAPPVFNSLGSINSGPKTNPNCSLCTTRREKYLCQRLIWSYFVWRVNVFVQEKLYTPEVSNHFLRYYFPRPRLDHIPNEVRSNWFLDVYSSRRVLQSERFGSFCWFRMDPQKIEKLEGTRHKKWTGT